MNKVYRDTNFEDFVESLDAANPVRKVVRRHQPYPDKFLVNNVKNFKRFIDDKPSNRAVIGQLNKAVYPADAVFHGVERSRESLSDHTYLFGAYMSRKDPKGMYKRIEPQIEQLSQQQGVIEDLEIQLNPTQFQAAEYQSKITKRGNEMWETGADEREETDEWFFPFSVILDEISWGWFVPIFTAFFSEPYVDSILTYNFLWWYYYVTEYALVCWQLYFPFLDGFGSSPLFIWPVAADFYFSQFVAIVYFPLVTMYFFTQFAKYKRYGLLVLAETYVALIVVILFASVFFVYYYFGIAPFFTYCLSYCFLSIGLYFFIHFPLARVYFFPDFPPDPVLYLPAPPSKEILYLPKYSYKYSKFYPGPFPTFNKKPFTKFPFISSTVGPISAHYRLIRKIQLADYYDPLFKEKKTFFNLGVNLPGTLSPYSPHYHGFSRDEYIEVAYMERERMFEEFDEGLDDHENHFVIEYMNNPPNMSMRRYLDLTMLQSRYMQDAHFFFPFADHWHPTKMAYLRNWLNFIRPSPVPKPQYSLLIKNYMDPFQVIEDASTYSKASRLPLFPRMTSILNWFFNALHIFFDCVTGYALYKHGNFKSNDDLERELQRFSFIFDHAFYLRDEFFLNYIDYLFYFYNNYNWYDRGSMSVSRRTQICQLLMTNYCIILLRRPKFKFSLSFINSVLLYVLDGGNVDNPRFFLCDFGMLPLLLS
jgi:hypothetical protein